MKRFHSLTIPVRVLMTWAVFWKVGFSQQSLLGTLPPDVAIDERQCRFVCRINEFRVSASQPVFAVRNRDKLMLDAMLFELFGHHH